MNATQTQTHVSPAGWAVPWRQLMLLVAALAMVVALANPAMAQRERRSRGGGSPEDYQASRLLKSAQDLLEAGEDERGVKILQEVLRQFPTSTVRFQAFLELGKHHMEINEEPQAIKYLSHLREIESDYETADGELPASLKDTYLEGLYLTGVAYFQMRSYGQAFPVLRKITTDYPNTVWANQSYYYIGMCHFSQGNWTKAIEALSLVGTFVDPNSPTIQYAEAGRRFYVRIEDTDLPVMYRLGKEIKVKLVSSSGDEEVVTCIPLSGDEAIFVGSIPTDLAKPTKNDNTLQVLGGSEVTTHYVDANTLEGKTEVARKANVKLVSTANVGFTRGDYDTPASAVFLNQPAFLLLQDADLDTGDKADTTTIRVMSRFKRPTDEEEGRVDIDSYLSGATDEDQWEIRDELTVTLTERGESPVRSGQFGGKFFIEPLAAGVEADTSDDALSAMRGDEIVATYSDELHVHGTSPRTVIAKAPVVNEIVTVPRPAQFIVTDPEIAAKKNLVEAEAYLELARIFRSMGLAEGSTDRAEEGLTRVADVISQGSRREKTISDDLVQQAYKLRWELHLVKKDYNSAIATCRLFSKLFPNSAFVDEALMTVAEALADQGDKQRAMQIYREVSNLSGSLRRAEAMFRIAEMTEAGQQRGSQSGAVQAYKEVAEKFPDSPYAGQALAKLIDYRIENKDYALANDLLEQTFNDYPDAEFLDSMLLKWVIVSFRMGDYDNALEKCRTLIFQYPDSPFAAKANQILPQLEKRANR